MKKRNESGSIVLALVVLLVLAGIGAVWLKRGLLLNEVFQADYRQKDLQIKAQGILSLFQLRHADPNYSGSNLRKRIDAFRQRYIANGCTSLTGSSCTPAAFTSDELSSVVETAPGQTLVVNCVAQGKNREACNESHLAWPKIIQFKLSKMSPDDKVALNVEAELQLAPSALNDFSYLVLHQKSNPDGSSLVNFAGGRFGGKVGILFDNPVVGNANPALNSTIRFSNPRDPEFGGPTPLIFEQLFSSNVPQEQIQYGIPNPTSTTNPPAPYYATNPPEFRMGYWPSGQAPQNLLADLSALKDAPGTIKWTGVAPRNAIVEMGSSSDPCAMRIRVEIPSNNNCSADRSEGGVRTAGGGSGGLGGGVLDGSPILPGSGGGIQPNLDVPPSDDDGGIIGGSIGGGGGGGIVAIPGHGGAVGGGNSGGLGGIGSTSPFANPCRTSYTWHEVGTPGADPEGKTFYVTAQNPVRVTSFESNPSSRNNERSASVCKKFTVLFGNDAWISKSIERKTASGQPARPEDANVALINLNGSNFVNENTYSLVSGSQFQTLANLKTQCPSSTSCNFDRSNTSLNLEVSMISVADNGNALKVSPNLIDNSNPGELGKLSVFGTFITDQLGNNRTLTVSAAGNGVIKSGFSDVSYVYNPGILLGTPPGLGTSSAEFPFVFTVTQYATNFSEINEAMKWADSAD